MTLQTFGTYPTLEEAAVAYDIGVLLCRKQDTRINNDKSNYMRDGKFLPWLEIPRKVIKSVQTYLQLLKAIDLPLYKEESARIVNMFEPDKLPFSID
jgi:hypothetical protein